MTVLMLLFTGLSLHAAPARNGPPQQPRQPTYQEALYEQVLFQERRAAEYLTWLQHDPNVFKKFEEASKLVEVKKSLFNHFATSPALRSPAVRKQLYEIMSKNTIEGDDLIALQNTVNAELKRSE